MRNWDTDTKLGWLIFFAMTAALVYHASTTYLDIQQSVDWEAQTATMKSVRLYHKVGHGDDPDTYETLVTYDYFIGGQLYTGDRVAAGYGRSNVGRHFQINDKLKYARKVVAWVNPTAPEAAILAKGWNETALLLLCFTFVWTCGFMGGTIWGLEESVAAARTVGIAIVTVAVVAFLAIFGRLALASHNEDYAIKLEDKITVLERLSEEEIKRVQLEERVRAAAFKRVRGAGDTVRVRMVRDTFYVE